MTEQLNFGTRAIKKAIFKAVGPSYARAFLLSQLVTGMTSGCCRACFMAVYTSFHRDRDFLSSDRIALHHFSVAIGATDLRLVMPRMAEDHEVLNRIDLLIGKRCSVVTERRQSLDLRIVLLYAAMAGHALAYSRERRLVPSVHSRMAIVAADLQVGVRLMTEADRYLPERCRN